MNPMPIASNYRRKLRIKDLLACPACHSVLLIQNEDAETATLECMNCLARYRVRGGIYRLLTADRMAELEAFNRKYDRLRQREGFASDCPGYYEALPFEDVSGRNPHIWRLRALSFRWLQKWLLHKYGKQPVIILDAGAGSGWMSQRLGDLYSMLAVDINAGPHGLAAIHPFKRKFVAIQAELNALPFKSMCLDAVIASASLHHAPNPQKCLAEFYRVLKPGGRLIVMDTPTYVTNSEVEAAHQRSREYYRKLGMPEMAEHYRGLTMKFFVENRFFNFRRLRPDIVLLDWVKKTIRRSLGKPGGACFPFWVGEPKCRE